MDDIPTLHHIAIESGFSKSTVSLALRHHPRIPEITRHRIEEIAAKLGYRPDPALARIAANRWRRVATHANVAFVTTNHPGGSLLDTESINGARIKAAEFGYQVVHFRFEDYGSAKRLGEVIYSRGITGVIVGKLCQPDFPKQFPWQHFATVACDTGFVRPPIQLIMPDHAHAVDRAWREAAACGYQRIGMALFDEYTAIDYFDKVSAYLFNQRLLPAKRRLNVGHFSPAKPDALQAWIKKEKPDAILGFNAAVYHWLVRLGYKMPQDLGFVSLMRGNVVEKKLSMLQEDANLLGQYAMEQLNILLQTNQYGLPKFITTRLIESTWVPGETLRNRSIEKRPANRSKRYAR